MLRLSLGAMWFNLAYIGGMHLGATLPSQNYVTYVYVPYGLTSPYA